MPSLGPDESGSRFVLVAEVVAVATQEVAEWAMLPPKLWRAPCPSDRLIYTSLRTEPWDYRPTRRQRPADTEDGTGGRSSYDPCLDVRIQETASYPAPQHVVKG